MRTVFWITTLCLAAASCAYYGARFACAQSLSQPAAQSEEDPVAKIRLDARWRFDPDNPVIRFGDLRPFATWNDPCVLKSDDGYVMYFTTAVRQPGSPPVQPFRAISADGRTWRLDPEGPLLRPGSAGQFDSASVETPSVVRFGGKFHLYYTGVGAGGLSGPMSIGHAVSEDGTSWTKDSDPVLAPTGNKTEWNGYQVAEPAAVVYRDRIYLYFAAVGLRQGPGPPASRVIGLSVSADGVRFNAPERVLGQGGLFSVDHGFDGYSTPAAAVHDGKVHLFFDVGRFDATASRKWTQVALHHAVSADGRSNWLEDQGSIARRGQSRWLGMEVRSPAPLFDGDRLRLWFAGNADPSEFLGEVRATGKTNLFGIGMAELSLTP